MSQYSKEVETQRLKLESEKWAKTINEIHSHSMSSMFYDTRPEDTVDNKSVTDISYNNGLIKRTQNGKHIHTFGEELKGPDLVCAYERSGVGR